jgi:hypothetical protein
MTRRRMLGPLRGYGVLLALVCGACAAGLPIDRLRDTTLSVESLGSVYLIDASGEHATPVLERKQTRARSDQLAQLFDEYYEPSLSPDGAYVACVRLRNNAHWGDLVEPQPLQSSEIMIARVSDRSERVIMSVPRRAPAWNILAPVWSVEGDQIFFAVDRRVWSYALAGARLDPLVELPTRYFGGFTWDHGRGEYLRASSNGTRLFGLLRQGIGRDPSNDAIVEIDLTNGALSPLWSGTLSTGFSTEVDRPLPPQIGDDAAQALFGSREFPVFAPRHSRDRRFYFFGRHEVGWLGRVWVAGYDRETRREFEVRTMWRTLVWK